MACPRLFVCSGLLFVSHGEQNYLGDLFHLFSDRLQVARPHVVDIARRRIFTDCHGCSLLSSPCPPLPCAIVPAEVGSANRVAPNTRAGCPRWATFGVVARLSPEKIANFDCVGNGMGGNRLYKSPLFRLTPYSELCSIFANISLGREYGKALLMARAKFEARLTSTAALPRAL